MIPGVVKMPIPMTLEMTSAAASTGPRTRFSTLCNGGAAADTLILYWLFPSLSE